MLCKVYEAGPSPRCLHQLSEWHQNSQLLVAWLMLAVPRVSPGNCHQEKRSKKDQLMKADNSWWAEIIEKSGVMDILFYSLCLIVHIKDQIWFLTLFEIQRVWTFFSKKGRLPRFQVVLLKETPSFFTEIHCKLISYQGLCWFPWYSIYQNVNIKFLRY